MNTYLRTIILILTILIASFYALADLNSIQKFSQVNGLPNNNVNQVFEDSRGVVWLATNAGLCQFNGFKAIYCPELSRLQGEQIISLTENSKGNLIIAVTGAGLYQFNGDELSLISAIPTDVIEEIHDIKFADEKLFIGTSSGLYMGSQKDGLLKLILVEGSRGLNVGKIAFTAEDSIVLDKNHLIGYSLKKNRLIKRKNGNLPIIELNKKPDEKNMKIGTSVKYLDVLCDIIGSVSNSKQTFLLLRYFNQDIEHRKLIVFEEGTFKEVVEFQELISDNIQCIFKRRNSDDLMIGTSGSGLLHVKRSMFSFYKREKLGFKNTCISDIASGDDGSLYVASGKQVIKVKNNKIIKRVRTKDFCKLSNDKNCSREFLIYAMKSHKDKLWIATNYGFFTLNRDSFIIQYQGIAKALQFAITPQNELFCFTGTKFGRYRMADGKLCKLDLSIPEGFNLDISKIVCTDSDIWVSTRNKGIIRFNNDKLQYYNRNSCGIHNVVNDMLVLSDSILIAGGNNGIIYKLSYTSDQLKIKDSLDYRDGLNGISVHGFQYLPDGSLWCGTNTGVYRFDYKSWQSDSIVKYRFWNSSFADFNFTGKESLIDSEGNIWVNGGQKIMKIEALDFDKKEDDSKPSLLKLKIKHIDWKVNHSNVDRWTNIPNNPIHLKYYEDNISFQIGMLYCENPNNVKYRYRLAGFEEVWSDWSDANEAVYSNLSGGTYQFEIESRNLSSDKISRNVIGIEIETAWWATYWAKSVLGIILLVVSFYTYKIIKYKIRKEEKGKTKQYNRVIGLKIKALQNQLDPHFICNSLNSIQSYILCDEDDKALEYLSDFSMILRRNINDAHENKITLADELSYLKLYLKLEQMRFEDKFDYQITVDSDINPIKIKIPPMLIQPFLAHSIKNGLNQLKTNGKLMLSFSKNANGNLQCVIKDNGVWNRKIEINEFNKSDVKINSLQITVDRLKLLNKVRPSNSCYNYSIQEVNDSRNKFSGVRTVLEFPNLK